MQKAHKLGILVVSAGSASSDLTCWQSLYVVYVVSGQVEEPPLVSLSGLAFAKHMRRIRRSTVGSDA
jgi:hypothetical protein